MAWAGGGQPRPGVAAFTLGAGAGDKLVHVQENPAQSRQPHDLQDFMDEVSLELAKEYTRIARRSREDPGTAGDEEESHWKEVLEGWLPSSLPIVAKGRILAVDGRSSPQVDVLVLHPAYPKKLLGKKQYLAGGVVAAFECKLTLRGRDFVKIAETARSVRGLVTGLTDSPYAVLHSPIIYGVLAHSSEWSDRGSSAANLEPNGEQDLARLNRVDSLLQGIQNVDSHPREALDVLCISDLGCWTRFSTIMLPFQPREVWDKSRALYGWPAEGVIHDQYSRWARISPEWEGPPNPIYVLISKLLRRIAWEFPEFRSMADYWNLAEVPGRGGGAGTVRNWSVDMLGDVAGSAQAGGLVNGQHWHPWSMGFH
jgi:hypothetical protein